MLIYGSGPNIKICLFGSISILVCLMLPFSETQTVLGPVILIGPQGLQLKKPMVISFQHCASVKHGNWQLSVCGSFSPCDEPAEWQVGSLC